MTQLLHVDASIQGDGSVSRSLTARAADGWRRRHPTGTVVYGEGAPKQGWDHATAWLPHGLSMTGLEPRFITAELTLAHVVPAMSGLIPLAERSRRQAEAEIDALWSPLAASA